MSDGRNTGDLFRIIQNWDVYEHPAESVVSGAAVKWLIESREKEKVWKEALRNFKSTPLRPKIDVTEEL